MTKYEARYLEQASGIYVIIVGIDPDGTEEVLQGYSRWFLNMAAARFYTEEHIKRM